MKYLIIFNNLLKLQLRYKNQALKNDVNKAVRVIQRDIGDAKPDDLILNENWKGRQQQIENLSRKIS